MCQAVGLEEREAEPQEEGGGQRCEELEGPAEGEPEGVRFRIRPCGPGPEGADAFQGAGPGVIMLLVPFFPAVQGGDGDAPLSAERGHRLCALCVVIQDGEDEEQGIVGEGDQAVREDGMAVVTGCMPSAAGAFAALFAQADGDQDLLVDPLSVFYVSNAAAVGGGLPGVPDPFAAALAGMSVGVIVDEGSFGKLQLIGTGGARGGGYGDPLHWLILSLAPA